jgi:hypothetical protein
MFCVEALGKKMMGRMGVAYSPALCERCIELKSEVYARGCTAGLPGDGPLPHMRDYARTTGSETRCIRHDEEESLTYRDIDLESVDAFAIVYR